MHTSDRGYSITGPIFARPAMERVCRAIAAADWPRTKAGVRHVLGVPAVRASVTPVTCAVPVGAVVAMRPLVVHGSSKATDDQPRRVLHIEYAASIHFGPGLELAVG